jgi:hypothetical protein
MAMRVISGCVLLLLAALYGSHAAADTARATVLLEPVVRSVAEQQPTPIPTIPPLATLPVRQPTPPLPQPTAVIPVATATAIRPVSTPVQVPVTAQPAVQPAPAQVPARQAPPVAVPAQTTAPASTAPRAGSMPLEIAQVVFAGSALMLGGGLYVFRRKRTR